MLDETPWFKFCAWCGGKNDAGLFGGIVTVANLDGSKSRYHVKDCWPRARYQRDGTPFITCHECGICEAGEYTNKEQLAAASLCFSCNFWAEKVLERDNPDVVRINGVHYHIGEERNGGKQFSGFGGRQFAITFHNGRQVTSTNLWCQGDIPARFADRLPDNATWTPRD